MSAMDIFREGGFIMYPLLVFSVLIWTVALHKMFFLRSFTKSYTKIADDVSRSISSGRLDDIKWAISSAPKIIAAPHEVLLDDVFTDKEDLSDRLNRRLSETNAGLKQHLWILGTIGSSAPFVGLFGTVLGIMESFKAIGASGKSGFSVVAAGISESLIATAAGIIVAVIAVLFYNYFQTKVNGIAQDFRIKIEDSAEIIFLSKRNRK